MGQYALQQATPAAKSSRMCWATAYLTELEATTYFLKEKVSLRVLSYQIPMASFSNQLSFHKHDSKFPWSHAQSIARKATSKCGKSVIS